MILMFELYVLLVSLMVIVGVVKFLPQHKFKILGGFFLWMIYGGMLSYSQVLANPTLKPPALVFLMIPFVIWIGVLIFTKLGTLLSSAIPLYLLVGVQGFRVGVEYFLEQLWQAGLIPQMMTYHGSNFDIVVGVTGIIMGVLIYKKMIAEQLVKSWNIVGILILLNVVLRGILTVPGPINFVHDDFPNIAITMFPFSYIVILMVPLAMTLHVLSLKKPNK